jgi:hypothetical protein
MKSLKMLFFATVFALTAVFTVAANAGNKQTSGDCWTDISKVGQPGFEDKLQSDCPGQRQDCCYIVNPNDPNSPITLYKLPLQ